MEIKTYLPQRKTILGREVEKILGKGKSTTEVTTSITPPTTSVVGCYRIPTKHRDTETRNLPIVYEGVDFTRLKSPING